jgi:TRAP-type mannitol/chloroaromatic compound transport system substrate-binding protein
MFGLGLGGKVAIGMGIVLLVTMAGSAWYFKYSQNKLAEANQKVAAEQARAESAEANLEFMQNSIAQQQQTLARLAEESVQIRQEQQEVIDIFAEHDLKRLAEAKPNLIEKRVNAGTQRVFDELEELTNPLSYIPKPGKEFIKEEE